MFSLTAMAMFSIWTLEKYLLANFNRSNFHMDYSMTRIDGHMTQY